MWHGCQHPPCCCCGLSRGVLVVAAMTNAAACITIVALAMMLTGALFRGTMEIKGSAVGILQFGLVTFPMWLLSGVLMIIGNVKKKKNLYIPWIFGTSIIILAKLALAGFIVFCHVEKDFSLVGMILLLCALLPMAFLWIYCIVVVVRHHSELQRHERDRKQAEENKVRNQQEQITRLEEENRRQVHEEQIRKLKEEQKVEKLEDENRRLQEEQKVEKLEDENRRLQEGMVANVLGFVATVPWGKLYSWWQGPRESDLNTSTVQSQE